MDKQLLQLVSNLAIGLINLTIERVQNDPISLSKIKNGEKLDNEDLKRLGIDRDTAIIELEEKLK